MRPSLPITASALWTLGIFLVALVSFHLILVVALKLDKVGWKKVDYFWLGFTALSLLTAASEVRRLVAGNRLAFDSTYRDATYERLRDRADFMRSGAVCVEFVRSEFSPSDFDESQAQFRKLCDYGKKLYASLPSKPPDAFLELKLPARPAVTDQSLLGYYEMFDSAWNEYAQAERWIKELKAASARTDTEEIFLFLSPIFLAVALALRITKVTGEIRLERYQVRSSVRPEKQGKAAGEELEAETPNPGVRADC